jgi:hypothetical protein
MDFAPNLPGGVFDGQGAFGFPLPRGSYRVGVGLNGYPGHTGQDFPAPIGTPVFAPFSGRLQNIDLGNRSYGKYANLVAGSMRFIGAHLSSFTRKNGMVKKGDIIGRVGSTGNSTGPHLHAEFRNAGRVLNPRNLLKFARGGFPKSGQFAWVGEEGPELVRFNQPARVFSNRRSQEMMHGGAQEVKVTIEISGDDDMARAFRSMVRKGKIKFETVGKDRTKVVAV